MIDSKNFLWLGAFFSLLFITFCVSTHLDDLNPNFITENMESSKNKQSFNEDINKDTNNEESRYIKEINIVDLTQNNSSYKDINKSINSEENKSKEISKLDKVDKTEISFKKRDDFSLTDSFILKNEKKSKEKSDKNITIQKTKNKIQKEKSKLKKIKKDKRVSYPKKGIKKDKPKAKKIEILFLQKNEVDLILKNTHTKSLKRFISKYKRTKNHYIIIKNRDINLLHRIKDILIRNGINKRYIKIKKDRNNKLILELYKGE